MPSQGDINVNSFEDHLDSIMGPMGFQRPFSQWQQDSDTNGVTEAPNADDDSAIEDPAAANNENDPSVLPANLPEPGTGSRRQQLAQPQAQHSRYGQAEYRLGPRKKVSLTDPELDFEIFEDETATVGAPFKPDYYGSSVPALGERNNLEDFDYSVEHQLRRHYHQLLDQAIRTDDETLYDLIERVREQRFTTWQRFSGAIEWMAGSDPMDVWLWVEDKGYHRRWTDEQIVRFKEFLQFMKTCILSAIGMEDEVAAKNLDDWNTSLLNGRFKGLGLTNLCMLKHNEIRVSFMPDGLDEKLLYRADFTPEELEILDAGWGGPGRWAPGEELEAQGNEESEESDGGKESEESEESE
ncbi:hypothetical protein BBK36DRAFT_1097767, partial [Trichoderma citrinoviride]